MKPNIGIADTNVQAVALILNTLLADEYVLYTKTRKYHWNVEGMHFHDLHLFFESQYEELDEIIDKTAERVRQLGHYAIGSMKDFLSVTHLLENAGETGEANNMIQNLMNDHETIIRTLREDIVKTSDQHKDLGNGDFLTGLMEQHEKMAWMLRANLG